MKQTLTLDEIVAVMNHGWSSREEDSEKLYNLAMQLLEQKYQKVYLEFKKKEIENKLEKLDEMKE